LLPFRPRRVSKAVPPLVREVVVEAVQPLPDKVAKVARVVEAVAAAEVVALSPQFQPGQLQGFLTASRT
jgi:hypothetical protein